MPPKKTAAPKSAASGTAKKLAASGVPFSRRLVLFQYLLGALGVSDFETLRGWLKEPEREGLDEEGVARFTRTLIAQRRPDDEPGRYVICRSLMGPVTDTFEARVNSVTADDLLRFDGYIVGHTRHISRRRPAPVSWKYFQHLALLFVEIYLDRWFGDAEGLRAELNQWVVEHNRAMKDNLPLYEPGDLRTLALWCATGSGKTLLLHMNVLQFRHALERFGKQSTINRTLLVTPGESLSRQHIDELARSNLLATAFVRTAVGGLFQGRTVEVLESSKLAEEDGDKTVSVAAFEQNNLVLIDEGHHGAGGDVIRRLRDELSKKGFAFEYSATFGQAMKAAKKPEVEAAYARAVVFDYAYRRFYADGFGKDFRVLNVADGGEEALHHRYLVACLLAFYQQLRLYEERTPAAYPFQIERPLWIFVGASVNAVRTVHGRKVSDVQQVLRFLARFVGDEEESAGAVQMLLNCTAGLRDAKGRELFENQFTALVEQGGDGHAVFADVIKRVFLAEKAAKVHAERLEGTDGEIALRLGDAEPFGLVNVGDAAGLMKLLRQADHDRFVLTDRPVAASIFDRLRAGETRVSVLIGSQKFATGWDTARVSTMGLMKIGGSEGSQIIQLFGRGVRLRGFGNSLKRSTALPTGVGPTPPRHLRYMETLQVFGVSAEYMVAFESYLRDEEVSTKAEEVIEVPVEFLDLPDPPLKTLRVRGADGWIREDERPRFGEVSEYLRGRPVKLDWYPRLRAVQSAGVYDAKDAAREEPAHFTAEHVAYLDLDRLVESVEVFRVTKGWTQIAVTRAAVAKVLCTQGWYALLAPPETLAFDDPGKVRVWEEIAEALLLKYVDRLAKVARSTWESGRIEDAALTKSDPNLELLKVSEAPGQGYRVTVSVDNETLVEQVRKIAKQGATNQGGKLEALRFGHHLFSPLLWIRSDKLTELTVKPVALNHGEGKFVEDLAAWCEKHPEWFASRQMYLLRNRALAGVGFFDEGGFYPDFILWVVEGGRQEIAFIDPKGIYHPGTLEPTKFQLHKRIKEIEKELGDPNVALHAFIISNTKLDEIPWKAAADRATFEGQHVLFQDRDDYLDRLLGAIVATETP